jgi:hypothetical protein
MKTFIGTVAALLVVTIIASMTTNRLVAAGSSVPSRLGAAIRSPDDVKDRSAGPAFSSARVAGAFDPQGQGQ